MKNFTKKLIASISTFTILTTATPLSVFATENLPTETPKERAWPGRPGGNGDGSEEWLQGSYGETNGPYKLINSGRGYVSDLNHQSNIFDSITGAILGAVAGSIPGGAEIIASGFVTGGSIGSAILSKPYGGSVYEMNTYVSGRCMKIVIVTYGNENFTGTTKTYTNYVKW